ncbi:hypothetical protein BCIN_03g00960 [Botrytis cinerea B05.10]|uniref:GTP cyclohydrolase 1 n=1 Tax=Botryotinia fuckeliana (strain B05.10) TaxID=332648 RepID=A0A384JAZ4_BOTFB|nr:hypothetical protein BCIN_03g00960 [Botrytis cinerea B05.10]ATZ47795.1 hypothetical protein BCIN_03g00960 [Botrytis cinerea B05.10]
MSINPGSSTEPLSSGSDDQSTLTDTDSNGEIVDGHDLNDLGEFVLKLLISPKSSQNTNKDSGHILNDPIPQASPTEIAATIRTLLCQIGEDTNRDGLKKTPERYAKALQFFTQGYKEKSNELINGAIFNEDTEDMVIVSGIDVFSLCEHHMLPFFGKVHIGYIPNGRVLGLSKFARIVEMFSRRLQVQERLTTQIADTIVGILEPRGVAVIIECKHMCMMMRGVEKTGSGTLTQCMRGVLKDDAEERKNFHALLQLSKQS